VLAETDAGAFLAAMNLDLQAGENKPMALTLYTRDETAAGVGAQGQGLPGWAKWLIVGAVGLAALYVVDELTDDEEPCASPPCTLTPGI
jgi:hypothetical protein